MDKEIIELLSYAKLSQHRINTLKLLNDEILFPSEVGEKLKISPANISRILKGLQNKGLVICLNPDKKVGRLFQTTNLGKELLKHIK